MASEFKVTIDVSELESFKKLLNEVSELADLVPDYLEHEKKKHIQNISNLSDRCLYTYKN